ncbi:MAG: SDR family oxidoreductase [Pseudomonadota bacterium]
MDGRLMETRVATAFDPAGATAVVTGGGSGIGRALGAALLQRGARHVVLADVSAENVASAAEALRRLGCGGQVHARGVDVSVDEAVRQLVSDVESAIGPIDLWCSNAGVTGGCGIGEPHEWAAALGVNVLGHVHSARHVLPVMRGRGAGHFVVTASAAGLLSDLRSAPYTASKHAAVAFAEWLAITCAGEGIAVHCVCPEGVKTAMTRSSSANAAKGLVFLEASEVAECTLDRMREGRFLVLPHARVAEFEVRRATDRERWLNSMRQAFSQRARAASVN